MKPNDSPRTYVLERLFVDQDHDWIRDVVAPVLAWVPGTIRKSRTQPFRFDVAHTVGRKTSNVHIDVSWDAAALETIVPGVQDHARRLRTGRSAQREHVTELAAYGLTFVAISVLLPGRRVKTMRKGSAPDILFDVTPGALRGVEAAGRSKGGRPALLAIRQEKAAQLAARGDLAEVHLSLWSASPRISIMERVKP